MKGVNMVIALSHKADLFASIRAAVLAVVASAVIDTDYIPFDN